MSVGPPTPATEVPRARRKNVLGYRAACERVFGPGAFEQTLEELPPHLREATAGLLPLEEWVPEAFVVAWFEAVWRGAARENDDVLRTYVAATVVQGFGHVRRLLLRLLTPETIAERAQILWREEHSTGLLEAQVLGPGRARLRLRDHPYIETALMRGCVAEALRCTVSLTRAKNVTVTHAARGTPLLIDLAWDSVT